MKSKIYLIAPVGPPNADTLTPIIERLGTQCEVYRSTRHRDHDYEFEHVDLVEWSQSLERKSWVLDRNALLASDYLVAIFTEPRAISLPCLIDIGRADVGGVPCIAFVSKESPFYQPGVIECFDSVFTELDDLFAFFGV